MRRNQIGTSLIELVIATSVISILTILMMNFLVSKIADNAIKNATADMQLQTQLALEVLNRDIKQSATADNPNRWADTNSPGSPANDFSWTSDADTIILAKPVLDQNSNVIYEDQQGYVSYKNNLIYFVNGGTLYKRVIAAPVSGNVSQTSCPSSQSGCPHDDSLLANTVSGFSVHYYDANDSEVPPDQARSVSVTLRLSRSLFNRDLEVEQTIRSVFRNE